VSLHFVFPDGEVLIQLVPIEEPDFLEVVVGTLIGQPLLAGEELCFFVMVECDALGTDCHVLVGVAFGVGNDLVVVGMRYAV
jgi:hypothetical protein